MNLTRRGFLVLSGGLAVAACEGGTAPEPFEQPVPQVTFRHLPPIRLDAAALDVRQPFVAPGQPPNIEHLLPTPPARVAANWARDRLRAAGSGGQATYAILDASITETDLATDKSLQALFKTQQGSRFAGRIEVRIDVANARGRGFAHAVVERSQTVRDDLTLNERDVVLVEFVEQMGRDLNRRLEDEIAEHLGDFVL
ncbi:MAG: hypothetical protein TEF_18000 [Rhizobiales bacterium NRL2]|jgi:hypothetical protein|nr:MAG: hypothetical protein TEF_18000 [Rhizobiales bacterium NRL2]